LLNHAPSLADELGKFALIVDVTYEVQAAEVCQPVKVNARRVRVQLRQIKLTTTATKQEPCRCFVYP